MQCRMRMERQMFCGHYIVFGNCRLRPRRMYKMPNWHLDGPEYCENIALIFQFSPENIDLRSFLRFFVFANLQLNILIIIRARIAITL